MYEFVLFFIADIVFEESALKDLLAEDVLLFLTDKPPRDRLTHFPSLCHLPNKTNIITILKRHV
jgi:hypothetical protein